MSKLEAVAHVVGRELGDLEKSHLTHVSESVALVSSLVAAGRSLAVPFADQQRILAPMLGTMSKLAEVGEGFADTHRTLSAYVRKHGLEPSAFGESVPDPSKAMLAPEIAEAR